MKLLKSGLALALLATVMSSFAVEKLVPFEAALHQEAVMAIATETKDSFFPGVSFIPADQRSMVEQMSLKEFESNLAKPGYVTFLLYIDENPVGFVQYFAYKESCESIMRGLEQKGVSIEQIKLANPAFMEQLRAKYPEKDADAPLLGKIEGVAVATKYQHKGYGKSLFQYAVEQLITDKKVAIVTLIVSENSEIAIKLYESEGFVVDESRSIPMLHAVAYQKSMDSAVA